MKNFPLLVLAAAAMLAGNVGAQSTYTLTMPSVASVFDPSEQFGFTFNGTYLGNPYTAEIGTGDGQLPDDVEYYSALSFYQVGRNPPVNTEDPVYSTGDSLTFTIPQNTVIDSITYSDPDTGNQSSLDPSTFGPGAYNIIEGSDGQSLDITAAPEPSTNGFFLFSAFVLVLTRTRFGRPWFQSLKVLSRGLSRQLRSCSSSAGFAMWSKRNATPMESFAPLATRRCAASTKNFERSNHSRPFAFGPTIGQTS
ncbi:MAG TPA: hypothetical protein VGI03_11695 [Verrucomicrobiae bacterium]|jgi:hypothetical protein